MKSGGLALLLFLFLLSIRAAGVDPAPTIEFTGVLVADGKTKIALTDKATGTTNWVEAGGEFKGFTLARYDAKEDAIIVKKDGREQRLPLVSAKSAPTVVAPAPAPALVPAATAAVSPNANLATPAAPTIVTVPAAAGPPTVNISVNPPPPAAPEPSTYTVKDGDTLTTISAATGVSMDQLKLLNPGANPVAILKTGDPIRTK